MVTLNIKVALCIGGYGVKPTPKAYGILEMKIVVNTGASAKVESVRCGGRLCAACRGGQVRWERAVFEMSQQLA